MEGQQAANVAEPILRDNQVPVALPSDPFMAACRDTRKAWLQTNLLAQSKPKVIVESCASLVQDGAADLVDLLASMCGPVATPDLHQAFGSTSHRHLEAAKMVARLLVKDAVAARPKGHMLDMERVKATFAAWIDSPAMGTGFDQSGAAQLEKIAALLCQSLPASLRNDPDAGARLRLALLAPFAAPLETLLVMSKLSQSFIDVMAATKSNVKEIVTAEQNWMRAHPDFHPEARER